ncbi:hypothetical protein EXS57_02130 [Candidatus Kaiserbacteria bacterium]|nr:hypothetical protein [Candidatus Kaiserbacteria bacterium]
MNTMFSAIGAVLLLLVTTGLAGCNEPAPSYQSTQSLAVEINDAGLLARGLMDDKKGVAWIPINGPRLKEGDKKREEWEKSVWLYWTQKFPNKQINIMSPVVEKGEIYGVTITYQVPR